MSVCMEPQHSALQGRGPSALRSLADKPRVIFKLPTLEQIFCKHAQGVYGWIVLHLGYGSKEVTCNYADFG